MVVSKSLNKYLELYKDFLHPNPNISAQAILFLKKDFRVEFMKNLLENIKEDNLLIRRKSILALGEYGEEILYLIVPLYFESGNNNLVKVSCLKTILKVTVKFNLNELNQDVMSVLDLAIKDSSPEIILSAISLLRQLGINGRDFLIKASRDKDLLRAKASVSALLEIKDQKVEDLFDELLNDESIDPMIKEDILRDKMI
tara:strand:+ start:115 stop:714 length:600 start_codon:yes stop_codon:yes gene_type:complete